MSTNKITEKVLRDAIEVERIGNAAVREAREENRRMGLPNVMWSPERGVYYELPDGTITDKSPFEKDAKKA